MVYHATMQFKYKDIPFDTEQMTAFATGLTWMPNIYVSENGVCAVEVMRASWEEPRIRTVTRGEALRMADSCSIPHLREFLTALADRKRGKASNNS